LLVNYALQPTSWSLLPSHPEFSGEVLEMTFPARDFILGYGPLYDTSMQTYTVSGQYSGKCEFLMHGTVVMLGHVSGDLNGDGIVDVADLIFFVQYAFHDGPPPPVPGAADLNCTGDIDIGDLIILIDFMFGNGPKPRLCQ